MMRLLSLRCVAVLMALTSLSAASLAAQDGDRFNHETHRRLFPLCAGCHSAMAPGAGTDLYPAAQVCARCHDGEQVRQVQWTGPQRRASNLTYDHLSHAAATDRGPSGSAATECVTCHRVPDRRGVEVVRRPSPQTCMNCHEHEAAGHLSPSRDCSVCHLTLTAAEDLAPAQIQDFPQPSTHREPDFLRTHGPVELSDRTACQTCHARESCTRCHLNGAELSDIQRLDPDPRVAGLLSDKAPEYPVPGSHDPGDWPRLHGDGASTASAGCGNCHVQASCQACHRDGSLTAIAALPHP